MSLVCVYVISPFCQSEQHCLEHHNPPVTIAKQIHCHFGLPISDRKVKCLGRWTLALLFLFIQEVTDLSAQSKVHHLSLRQQHYQMTDVSFEMAKHPHNKATFYIWLLNVGNDLKMACDWHGPVTVKGMDAICKHEPLYCALHCASLYYSGRTAWPNYKGADPHKPVYMRLSVFTKPTATAWNRVIPGWMHVWTVTYMYHSREIRVWRWNCIYSYS